MASTVIQAFIRTLFASILCIGTNAPFAANAIGLDTELLELRRGLREVTAGLSEGGALRDKTVAEILDAHFALITQPAPYSTPIFREPNEPAKVGWTDMRFGLAMLGQTYGGKDNGDIQTARLNRDTHAIAVESGVATLRQLRQHLTHREITFSASTDTYRLRIPIIIKDGATLRLGPRDILELSRAEGAYILNFGHLQIFGSTVRATPTPNPNIEEFVPFVTSVGTGSAHITGANFADLGFGSTEKFSGLSVIAYPPMRATRASRIENNRFDRLGTVMVIGQSGTTVSNNRFFDMRRNPLLISRSAHVEVTQNLFSGVAPTNAIRVLDGSDHTRIIGNLLLNGARAGIMVNGGSDHIIIRDNLIWKRDGGGVTSPARNVAMSSTISS